MQGIAFMVCIKAPLSTGPFGLFVNIRKPLFGETVTGPKPFRAPFGSNLTLLSFPQIFNPSPLERKNKSKHRLYPLTGT